MNKQDNRKLVTVPRRWFPLWTLDWYILREFLIKYSVLLLVFVILFVLGDVYRDIGDFLEAKSDVHEVLLYLLYKLPGNVRFILPISMLLGTMWTMATFGKNMEITAMRASGVSLFRCGVPILLVGLFVTFVNIYFNEMLVPHTERQSGILYDRVVEKRKHVQHLLAYRSGDRKRHWLFKTFAQEGEQNDVTIKTFWTREHIRQLVGDPGKSGFAGRVRRIFPVKSAQLLALPRDEMVKEIDEELRGRKLDLFASRVGFDAKKGEWAFLSGHFISYDRNDESRFSASQGTSVMHEEIPYTKLLMPADEIPERPNDILNAIREKDDLSTYVILDLVRRSPDMPERIKDIYMTVFYFRIAFPWACFLAVFLGIPLATKNERSGSLMAVITAVVMIVIYIVTAQIFLVLGKGGFIPPIIAGLTPTVGFILAGMLRTLFDRN